VAQCCVFVSLLSGASGVCADRRRSFRAARRRAGGRAGYVPLVERAQAAPLWFDVRDHKGVIRAIGDLRTDIERVTGQKPEVTERQPASVQPVIIGTVGRNALIDRLVAAGQLDGSNLVGKWESFIIATVAKPAPGVERALVIAGSDKRGTIYGVYELSRQIGVSPWHYWADAPVAHRAELHVKPASSPRASRR
jgi:hypothetical protein